MFLASIDELTFLCFQLARELSHPPAAGCTKFQLLEDASLLDKSQPIIPVVLHMALNAATLHLEIGVQQVIQSQLLVEVF